MLHLVGYEEEGIASLRSSGSLGGRCRSLRGRSGSLRGGCRSGSLGGTTAGLGAAGATLTLGAMVFALSAALLKSGFGCSFLLIIELAILVGIKLLQKLFLELCLASSESSLDSLFLLLVNLAILVHIELGHESGLASGHLLCLGGLGGTTARLGLGGCTLAAGLLGSTFFAAGLGTLTKVVRLGPLTEETRSLRAMRFTTEVVATMAARSLAEALPLAALAKEAESLRTMRFAAKVAVTMALVPLLSHAVVLRALSFLGSKSSLDGSFLLLVNLAILVRVELGHKLSLASFSHSLASIGLGLAGSSYSFLGCHSSLASGAHSLTGSGYLRQLYNLLLCSRCSGRRSLCGRLRSTLLSHKRSNRYKCKQCGFHME